MTARERILSLFALCLLGLLAIRSGNASSSCQFQSDGSELCEIAVQTSLSKSAKKKTYQYEIRRAKNDSPTVVVLPGGPGQGAIGDIETLASVHLIPENFGVIAIDPRGVGRNDFGKDTSGDMYSSAQVARDVYEVLRREHLQNYILFGESYGTVVATHLGNILSKRSQSLEADVPALPLSIILSRVVGEGFQDQIGNYNHQLERIMSDYSNSERTRIGASLKKIYHEFYHGNDTAFSAALMQALLFNIEAKDPGPLSVSPNVRNLFQKFAQQKDVQTDPVYRMLAHGYSRFKEQFPVQVSVPLRNYGMAETIKCRELSNIAEEAQTAFHFVEMKIKLVKTDCLQKGLSLDRPYRSQDFQISGIPVIYLQGNIDPATPLAGAFNHYVTQKNSQKIFLEMKGFAHVGFIGMWPCRTGLWNSFAAGMTETSAHIQSCRGEQISMIDPFGLSAETQL